MSEDCRKLEGGRSRLTAILPAMVVAVVCTGLIVEAIFAVIGGRENGDLLVMVCPILGAMFLSIPAGQAWWACGKILVGK